ncbi:hypothetical protein D3C77_612490 [compost metagenome]
MVGLQRGQVTRLLRPGQQRLGQRLHVTQRQVEALAGNGVQAVRGVAQHHQMRPHLLLGLDQRQWVEVPRADLAQGAQAIAEHALQLAQETALVDVGQASRVHALAGPDQRAAVIRQR